MSFIRVSIIGFSTVPRILLGGLHLFVFVTDVVSVPEILVAPEDATVTVGQVAVFTCETRGGLSALKFNATLEEDLPKDIRTTLNFFDDVTDKGSTFRRLTVPGKAEYNTIRVECLVVNIDGTLTVNESATLTVQGICVNYNIETWIGVLY